MKVAIITLTVLFLGSNAWWIYRSLDQGVSLTYATVSLVDSNQALDQTISLIPLLSSGKTSREEIISHFQTNSGLQNGFEKDGMFWIGQVALKFDAQGKLIAIQRAWN